MAFTATARIPTRPLSFNNSTMAMPKEILVDYVNHKIYISDINGDIVDVSGSGTAVSEIIYLTCDTAGDVSEKSISIDEFELGNSTSIVIKFANTNTAQNPTLNIGGTGAKNIIYRGEPISNPNYIISNRLYHLVYNGTSYEIVGDILESAKELIPSASESSPGLLDPDDKIKIDSIDTMVENINQLQQQLTQLQQNLSNYLLLSGGTMNGALIAAAGTDYTTYKVRNIGLSTSAATPSGNGNIIGVYS